MDGPRPPLQTEFPAVVQFLDRELRPTEAWSIAKEYPVAFSSTNMGNMRIITDADQVLSHAVMRPLIMKSPTGLLKVAAIGSVVTRSERRSEGLSRSILANCLDSARDSGCDFAILWTNLYDFYRKMGFELAGAEMALVLENEIQSLQPLKAGCKVIEGARVDAEALHRLYAQHTVSSLRTVEETRKYLHIPNARVYTLWDAQNVMQAYAVEGKGSDLDGYLHEWGGAVSALLPLFAHIRHAQGRAVTVIAPNHALNLIKRLRELGAKVNPGYLGMIKIINATPLFEKIKRRARALGIEDFALEKQGDKFYVGSSACMFSTDSEADIAKLIFGPQAPRELHPNFDVATGAMLARIFPIPMWIWGWDSI